MLNSKEPMDKVRILNTLHVYTNAHISNQLVSQLLAKMLQVKLIHYFYYYYYFIFKLLFSFFMLFDI